MAELRARQTDAQWVTFRRWLPVPVRRQDAERERSAANPSHVPFGKRFLPDIVARA
jgi:hypothetical protein